MPCSTRRFALDASVLITFGKNGEFRLIEEVLGGRGYVTDEVYDECRSIRAMVDSALSVGSLLQHTISDSYDLAFFAQVRLRMDRGEASAVTAARSLDAVVVSDDEDAIKIGGELLGQNRVIGTREILCFAVAHAILTPAQAQAWATTFIAGGAYIPEPEAGYFHACAENEPE
jgi:predicted nucleic acid-binding protein